MKKLIGILIVLLASCASPHDIKGFEKKAISEAAKEAEQKLGHEVNIKECDIYSYNILQPNMASLSTQGIFLENFLSNYNAQIEKLSIAVIIHKSGAYGFLSIGVQAFNSQEITIHSFSSQTTDPIEYVKGSSLTMNVYDTQSNGVPTIVMGSGNGGTGMAFTILIDSNKAFTSGVNLQLQVD